MVGTKDGDPALWILIVYIKNKLFSLLDFTGKGTFPNTILLIPEAIKTNHDRDLARTCPTFNFLHQGENQL